MSSYEILAAKKPASMDAFCTASDWQNILSPSQCIQEVTSETSELEENSCVIGRPRRGSSVLHSGDGQHLPLRHLGTSRVRHLACIRETVFGCLFPGPII